MLSEKEQLRYSRHLLLDKIGAKGQESLKQAKVLIVGMGGLGCPAAQYLAASGIGHLVLLDHDHIELSNLQRQVIYKTNHIKRQKVDVAQLQLNASNPEIKITALNKSVLELDLTSLLADIDVVLDCTDNIDTRYSINAACVQVKVPLVTAAATAGNGQLMVFDFKQADSPCYQCMFPNLKEQESGLNCSNAGVISPLLGVMGSMQALETIKLIVGLEQDKCKLTLFDAWTSSFNQINLKRSKNCPSCSS